MHTSFFRFGSHLNAEHRLMHMSPIGGETPGGEGSLKAEVARERVRTSGEATRLGREGAGKELKRTGAETTRLRGRTAEAPPSAEEAEKNAKAARESLAELGLNEKEIGSAGSFLNKLAGGNANTINKINSSLPLVITVLRVMGILKPIPGRALPESPESRLKTAGDKERATDAAIKQMRASRAGEAPMPVVYDQALVQASQKRVEEELDYLHDLNLFPEANQKALAARVATLEALEKELESIAAPALKESRAKEGAVKESAEKGREAIRKDIEAAIKSGALRDLPATGPDTRPVDITLGGIRCRFEGGVLRVGDYRVNITVAGPVRALTLNPLAFGRVGGNAALRVNTPRGERTASIPAADLATAIESLSRLGGTYTRTVDGSNVRFQSVV
jgi:hypothetical protein